jgi:hypothetical protein
LKKWFERGTALLSKVVLKPIADIRGSQSSVQHKNEFSINENHPKMSLASSESSESQHWMENTAPGEKLLQSVFPMYGFQPWWD